MEFTAVIKTVGLCAIPIFMLYFSYLFYDKNTSFSIILLIAGLISGCCLVGYEIAFKATRHSAPDAFEKYKGE